MIKLEIVIHEGGAKEFPDVYQSVVGAINAQGLQCTVEASMGDDL
jgi:hypothetical protein